MSDVDVYNSEEGDRPVEKSPRGRYIRFDIRLGTGAYKSVYKAYDTDQGIDVAWNAIDIGVLPASEKTRIIQEVQLLQKLEHKNIINFYGSWFSKEKNQVVFITEIMTSGTLKSYIKRVQFVKWKIIKRWCVQILEGLMYLHGQNPPVIHRDLKCDNIFINGNTGDLRIGDLGLSTQLAVQKSRAQSVLGTPEFMAPELYDESYDEKVDIYAFGMCVLEMVTKEVPYSECVNPAQIYKKVTSGIRPRGMQRIVSEAARDFIELCLSRGNGKIDVSAAYLLSHPFLKPSEEDNRMVKVLTDEELQQQEMAIAKPAPALPDMSPRKFAAELNMESAPKSSVTRKDSAIESASNDAQVEQKPLRPEPEAIASAAPPPPPANTSQTAVRAEEKTSGQHYIVPTKAAVQTDESAGVVATQAPASVLPPLPSAINDAVEAVEPVVDEPLSGQKDVDNHVEAFLSTMAGNEASIDNSRIALMGGRGHRIEINENEQSVDTEDEKEVPPAPVAAPPTAPATSAPPSVVEPATAQMAQPAVQAPADASPPVSRPASAPRIRAKRYEIRSSNDPTNPRSILLNLRIAIDGKSKEIKFPFNFFTESPHEVACELAVDVGILEPDLEDITDSISFLVTESKINNLPDLDQDIWDEAPEPHSFSSKPLPPVSKMTFIGQQVVSVTTQLPSESPAQQPAGLASSLPLMRSGAPPVVQQDVATPLVPLSLMPAGLREPAGPIPTAPGLERGVSALERGVAVPPPRIPRAQSELFQPDDYLSVLTEQERGAALGTSASDPNFLLHAVRNLDDRLKATKTSFGEQETLMEEKYQSEIERLRNMMSKLSEKTQRATLARYAREHMLTDDITGDTISMERLTAFSEDNAGLRSSPMVQQVPSTVTGNGVLEPDALPSSLGVRRYPSADPRLEAPQSPSHAADAPEIQLPTATEPAPVATMTAEEIPSEPLEPAQ